jgi:hypothetical protein
MDELFAPVVSFTFSQYAPFRGGGGPQDPVWISFARDGSSNHADLSKWQALDRTQPGLRMKKGRWGTMTHDYKPNGTTTLYAALVTLDGRVIGDYMPRHRHQEFIQFLKTIDYETPPELDLHLIVDNYGPTNIFAFNPGSSGIPGSTFI